MDTVVTLPNKEQICWPKLQNVVICKFILKLKGKVLLVILLSESPEGLDDTTSFGEIKGIETYL